MHRFATKAATLAFAAAAFSASPANAALSIPGKCYTYAGASAQQPMPVVVDGLAPGQQIRLTMNRGKRTGLATQLAVANAYGVVNSGFNSYFPGLRITKPSKGSTVTVQALDPLNPASVLAEAKTKVTVLAITVKGSSGKRAWKLSGLTPVTGKRVHYAHYFKGSKYRGRLKLGKAKNPCGYLSVRRPLTPFKNKGTYDVKITTSKKFMDTDPYIPGRVVLRRR